MTEKDDGAALPPLRLALGVLKLYPEINIQPPALSTFFPPFHTLSDLPGMFLHHVWESRISRRHCPPPLDDLPGMVIVVKR